MVSDTVVGPFAFVYWRLDLRVLVFGRDILGRRSMLACCDKETASFFNSGDEVLHRSAQHFSKFYLSSVASNSLEPSEGSWVELPVTSLYSMSIPLVDNEGKLTIRKFCREPRGITRIPSLLDFGQLACKFLDIMMESVRRRVCTIPNM